MVSFSSERKAGEKRVVDGKLKVVRLHGVVECLSRTYASVLNRHCIKSHSGGPGDARVGGRSCDLPQMESGSCNNDV